MACPFRTAFPFRAARQTYPVDLFSFSAVASSHERIECNAPMPTGDDTESCLKLRRFFQSPTTSGKAAGCRLFPFASVTEICCQHINKLRIGWWLHQRDAHDEVQKTVVRIPPARLNHCPQIALHAVARRMKYPRGIPIETLGNEFNAFGVLSCLLDHVRRLPKARQLTGGSEHSQQPFRVQRLLQGVFLTVGNVIEQRH